MQQRGYKPALSTYVGVIEALIETYSTAFDTNDANRFAAVQSAMAILCRVNEMYDAGESNRLPNVRVYNGILNEVAKAVTPSLNLPKKSNKIDYSNGQYLHLVEQATRLVHKMEERVLQRISNNSANSNTIAISTPNAATYTSLVKTLARSGDAAQAESVLLRLVLPLMNSRDIHSSDVIDLHSEVIVTWGRCDQGARSEALFQELMESITPSSPDGLKSANSFSSDMNEEEEECISSSLDIAFAQVLLAWARSTKDNAAYRAQTFFDAHVGFIRPNVVMYNALLAAWANNPSSESYHHAEAIVQRMRSNHDDIIEPNISTYNFLIQSLTTHPDVEYACTRADVILSTLDRLPNDATWEAVIQVWSRRCDVTCSAKDAEKLAMFHRKRRISL